MEEVESFEQRVGKAIRGFAKDDEKTRQKELGFKSAAEFEKFLALEMISMHLLRGRSHEFWHSQNKEEKIEGLKKIFPSNWPKVIKELGIENTPI